MPSGASCRAGGALRRPDPRAGSKGWKPRSGLLRNLARDGGDRGVRRASVRRRGAGAQDRLLSRSAREPAACRAARRGGAGAQCVLLQRRVFAARARGRRAREVCSIDSSGPALEPARRNLALDAELPVADQGAGSRPTSSLCCASGSAIGERLRPRHPRIRLGFVLGGSRAPGAAGDDGQPYGRSSRPWRAYDDVFLLRRHRHGGIPGDRPSAPPRTGATRRCSPACRPTDHPV